MLSLSAAKLIGYNAVSITSNVANHQRLRQLTGPSMSPDVVESSLPLLQDLARRHLSQWHQQCQQGNTVSGVEGIKSYTFEVGPLGQRQALPAVQLC